MHVRMYACPTYCVCMPRAAFSFRVGSRGVISGFAEAVGTMTVGARRASILPPSIAYGPRGMASFGIPGDTTLVYFLEIMPTPVPGDL